MHLLVGVQHVKSAGRRFFRRALRQMRYFGYKLVVLSTWNGLPIAYDLVPASTDERFAVEGVLNVIRGCDVYGDKGFIASDWQQAIARRIGNRLWTLHRNNQHKQHSKPLKRFISRVRQRIEGVFHEIPLDRTKSRTFA